MKGQRPYHPPHPTVSSELWGLSSSGGLWGPLGAAPQSHSKRETHRSPQPRGGTLGHIPPSGIPSAQSGVTLHGCPTPPRHPLPPHAMPGPSFLSSR